MATTKSAIRFDTREYRFSHGAEPRGFGSWAFDEADRSPSDGARIFWVHQATFGAAKKAAAAHFAALAPAGSNVFVEVLP